VWFFLMLLPVIGLVQVGLQSIADRYVYLPSIGLFIAVVWGAAYLCSSRRLPRQSEASAGEEAQTVESSEPPDAGSFPGMNGTGEGPVPARFRLPLFAAGTIIVVACGLDTRHQLGFWRNNITLFQHVVEVSPKNNYLGHFCLGISYGEAGQLDAAARSLTNAMAVYPDSGLARGRLGNVLLLQKNYAAAEPFLESQVRAQPQSIIARLALGTALAGQQKYVAAQAEYQAALEFNPQDPSVQQMATANAPKADAEQTMNLLAPELATNAAPEIHARAAQAETVLGRFADAVQQYKLALVQKPDMTEWLNNLAWLLATCPDAAVRDGSEAVRLAQHACELTQYQVTVCLGTLAAACAEAGRFDDAIANAQKACKRAAAQGESELLESNQRFLKLYQDHQSYHEPAPSTPEIPLRIPVGWSA
jgi:tetratricopeptide (TPR) repeat protein